MITRVSGTGHIFESLWAHKLTSSELYGSKAFISRVSRIGKSVVAQWFSWVGATADSLSGDGPGPSILVHA